MATFTVSTATLREKARLIRVLLEESETSHQQLWAQISAQVTALPRDIAATHFGVNTPWNTAIGGHYENYHQIALNMGTAADEYEKDEQDVKNSFDFS